MFPKNQKTAVPQSPYTSFAASILPQLPAVPPSDDGGIEIGEYLQILRRRWLLILLCIILAVGVTAFITYRMQKVYRATVTLRIETQAPQVLGKNVEDVVEMGTGSFWSNVEYYETQYRIIESRSVALEVVNQFNLHENQDFLGVTDSKKKFSKDDAAKMLQGSLTVEPIKDSRLALIHIDNIDPARAQLYANALAKAYVRLNLDAMHRNTMEAVDWLSTRLDKANSNLTESEEALREYKRSHDILSISLEDRQNTLTAQMTTAAANLTEATAKRIGIQARKSAVSRVSKVSDPMAIPIESLNSNLLIQQLKQNYATLSQEHGELSARYGENFPKMVEIKAKMDRIRTDIAREVSNVILSVNAELDAARATETGLKRALLDLESKAQDLADKEGKYKDLARTAVNNEQVYQLLTGRAEEAKLAKFLKVNNVEILDPALLPETPIKPRVRLNIMIAAIFGLILGIALAIVIEFSDRTVKTQEDIEQLDIPFLGIVPTIDTARLNDTAPGDKKRNTIRSRGNSAADTEFDTFVYEFPKSQIAESLRSIRTNLMFMTADRYIHRLLITSPSPQEGKTTVAINLAIVMAQSDAKVLLVDTDMRRPRLHSAFGINRPATGLSTMVLGQSTVEDSIVQTKVPNLDLLVCGPTPPNPSELIHTKSFRKVVDQVSGLYDKVIFDSPPIGVVTDAAILSKLVDGTLIVLKSLKTTRDASKHAVSIMKDIDSEILGAVLNNLDLSNQKYSKYYQHYYTNYGYYAANSESAKNDMPDGEDV